MPPSYVFVLTQDRGYEDRATEEENPFSGVRECHPRIERRTMKGPLMYIGGGVVALIIIVLLLILIF